MRTTPASKALDGTLLIAGLLLLWTAGTFFWGRDVLPSPVHTASRLAEIVSAPDFARNLHETLRAFLLALAIAFGAGVALGMPAKVAFGVIHGVIPVTIFTMNAVRNIPRTYFRTAGVLRMSAWRVGWRILLPAALPEIVAGLRLGFSLTLLGTLIGEMFASQYGIGQMLMHAIDRNEADSIMALSLMLFVFAVAASMGLLALDKHLRRGMAR